MLVQYLTCENTARYQITFSYGGIFVKYGRQIVISEKE